MQTPNTQDTIVRQINKNNTEIETLNDERLDLALALKGDELNIVQRTFKQLRLNKVVGMIRGLNQENSRLRKRLGNMQNKN